MKNNQTYIVMSARKNRRFWLAAGTALLVWQVNNQTAQADEPVTPTSSAETTVITANATTASNVVQLQSGAKTATTGVISSNSTTGSQTDVDNSDKQTSSSIAGSATDTTDTSAKTSEAASETVVTSGAKSTSTTPYIDGANDDITSHNSNATSMTDSTSLTGTQATASSTQSDQSSETDAISSDEQKITVDQPTGNQQTVDTNQSSDGYNEVDTSDKSETTNQLVGVNDGGTGNTVSQLTNEVTPLITNDDVISTVSNTTDSVVKLQSQLTRLRASSLKLAALAATPTVAQDYAAWDAITDTSRKGVMGTSEWWIDDTDNTLHLGVGQLADANVQFDENANVTDWGNVGWGQYVKAHDAKLSLVLEGDVNVGANARGLFNGLTFDLSDVEDVRGYFVQIHVEQTTDMSYMFERVTFIAASWVAFNDWVSATASVNAAHMFENVKCITPNQQVSRMLISMPGTLDRFSDMSYMFNNSEFSIVNTVFLGKMTTAQATSMAYMFNNCKNLTSLNAKAFETGSVTDMSYMFNGDEKLSDIIFNTHTPDTTDPVFNTSNVTNMSHMFTHCDALASLDVSGFNTSKVTNMSHMFEHCYAKTLDVAHFDTSQVTDMQEMFDTAAQVTTLDLSNFDTHLITNMDNMFTDCHSLVNLTLSNYFVDKQVTSMKQMFTNCAALTSIDLVNAFDTTNVTNMDQLFSGCQKLGSLDLSQFDTSHITNMADFFNDCESLTVLDGLANLNTTNVTTMANMFNNCASLQVLDLSNFETDKVTTMVNMFAGCASLSALDTTPLTTSSVTNMADMFKGDRALVSLDISQLDTSQVKTMSHMFEDVFADQKIQTFTGLEKLDTSNVTDMSYMFAGFFLPIAMSLNLVSFDTREVLNMQGMFKGYVNFKQACLQYLQTGSVTDMSYMFSGLVNQPQFTWESTLDTHNVTNMAYMFSNMPDIETLTWSQAVAITQVTNMQGMFANDAKLENLDLSELDTSKAVDMSYMFSGDSSLERLDLSHFDTSQVENMYAMFYLDSGLKNLNLSSFSGEKLQLAVSTVVAIKTFGLLNLLLAYDSNGTFQMNQFQTNLNTLTLGSKTKLALPKPTSVTGWIDTSTVAGQELITYYPTIESLEADFESQQLNLDMLVGADLAPSQGFSGVWINNATAETLTSDQLMARYDGTNPLATDATWTWQNILGKDQQVISGKNSTWTPSDSLAGLTDTSKTVNDLTTTITDTTTDQTLTSAQLNTLLQQPEHAGQYQIAYQYTDDDGTKQISVPVTLSLVANQSVLTTKDSVLQLGAAWNTADNIVSLLNADGTTTDLATVNGIVSVNGVGGAAVNTAVPGVYQLNYQITDSTGTIRTATATVIVNGLTLKQTPVDVSTDNRWDPMTNVDQAIDDQGETAVVELTITDADGTEVNNIKKPGTYQLNYHFTDDHREHAQTAVVNVTADTNHAELTVNGSSIYQYEIWDPATNLVSAIDSDGEKLDISALTTNGTVDITKIGSYAIEYYFTDQFGKLHSEQFTVKVMENKAKIDLVNQGGSLYVGGAWDPNNIAVTATNVDGTPVSPIDIDIIGTVDMSKAGNYELTYHFTDKIGKVQTDSVVVTVLENQASISAANTSGALYVDGTWDPNNIAVTAIDSDGSLVTADNIQIIGTVDMSKAGDYELTYHFTDKIGKVQTDSVIVTVLENRASIFATNKSGALYVGGTWNPDNIVVTATNVDGTPVNPADIDIIGTVDPQTVGVYEVTYSFTDQQGQLKQVTVPVEVLANLVKISVKADKESFRIGATWSAKDNLVSATNVDGTAVDLTDVEINSTVDPQTVGVYEVTYSFTDQQGKQQKVVVPVEVLANLAAVKVKADKESFRVGATWSAKANLVSATNVDGTAVDPADVMITSTVDPQAVGQYEVTYSFTDQQGKQQKVVVPVEVLANLAAIKVKVDKESFRIGATWSAKDNLVSATNVDGTAVDLADVMITSTVDPQAVGQYEVTYSFTDQQGQLKQVTVPVEVLANLAAIKVKVDSESFRVGATWSAKDNLVSATNVDGTSVDLADVVITSTVAPNTVGQYEVTYSFTDQQGKQQKVVVPVEVLANLAAIKVKADKEDFRIGATWSAKDNLVSATNVDGTAVDLTDVEINSTVDPQTVGVYEVTYSFTDQQGKQQKVVVPVEVLANLAAIKVKSDSESFRVGAIWSAKDNLVSATNVDGTAVDLTDVEINSTVDPQTVGVYEVTYSFADQQGKQQKVVVPVEVLANLAAIKVKADKEDFRIGATWSAKDNLVSATNVDGTSVDLADVMITSTVAPNTVGQYTVTYSFINQQGKQQKLVVPVSVLANYANLKLHQTELSFRAGDDSWQPEKNIAVAMDIDGSNIALTAMQIVNTVDSITPGTYQVSYAFTDQFGQAHNATATVTVLENLATLMTKQSDVTLYLGNQQWQPEDNLGLARNVDGSVIAFDQLKVLGHVDLTTIGNYGLTYQFVDQLGHLQTSAFTVAVVENQASIVVENKVVTLHVGDAWEPMMNLDSVTDIDGRAVSQERLTINVTKLNQRLSMLIMRSRTLPIVDTTTVGSYDVSYQFIDGNGNLQALVTTVNVLPNESTLKLAANDITIYVGDEWQPETNVVEATNVDGTPVTFDRLSVMGSVNTQVAGQYQVLYGFVDQQDHLQQVIATVTVLTNQAGIQLQHNQLTLMVGDEWQPLTNLQMAQDVDGRQVDPSELVITGKVDTSVPGTYQVNYSFTDQRGYQQQAVASVIVVSPAIVDQALLRLQAQTVTLRAGVEWTPLSNVAQVLDSDGSSQTADQVSVRGTLDLNTVGKYLLTYHFADQLGHDHTAVATVIVLANEASLQLRTTATTLKVGQTWDAAANISVATDVDGSPVNQEVAMTSNVDWQQPGTYQVSYQFVDQQGKLHAAMATVTLITADDGNTDNGSGNQSGNGNTDNGSSNQGGNGSTDNGTGNQGGNGNTDNGSSNQGGNGNTDNGTGNQGGNGSTDNGTGNQGGNGSTDNGTGNQGGNGNTDNGSGNQSGNGNTDNGTGNQGGNGNTDNGSSNQGGNGSTDNGSSNQGGNGSTDNGTGNQGGNGNTDNGTGNQGGNGNTDNGTGNQGGNGNTDNGTGNQGGNGNTDNGTDNQGSTGNTDNGSSSQGSNMKVNHESGMTDISSQPDIINTNAQQVTATRRSLTAINHHDNGAVSSTMARTDSRDLVTTDTVKSTETPRIGTPTQLPQTDEQTPATANWWGWLGLALTGLIAMIKPNKNKQD